MRYVLSLILAGILGGNVHATHPIVQTIQVQPVYVPVMQTVAAPVCHVQQVQAVQYVQPVVQTAQVVHAQPVQVQRVVQVQQVHHVAPVVQRVRVVERRRGPFLSLQIGR